MTSDFWGKGGMMPGFTGNPATKSSKSSRVFLDDDLTSTASSKSSGLMSKYEAPSPGTCSAGIVHMPMPIPGTDLVIHGGSCWSPKVKDADLYVGLDSGMKLNDQSVNFNPAQRQILYLITDMKAPRSIATFRELIELIRQNLLNGQKVHVGCIGGHGRTGTVLAALVSTFGERDAITYVRKNYCKKAVESDEQIAFLKDHFGIIPVAPSKGSYHTIREPKATSSKSTGPRAGKTYDPMPNHGSIWGKVCN